MESGWRFDVCVGRKGAVFMVCGLALGWTPSTRPSSPWTPPLLDSRAPHPPVPDRPPLDRLLLSGVLSWNYGRGSRSWPTQSARVGFLGSFCALGPAEGRRGGRIKQPDIVSASGTSGRMRHQKLLVDDAMWAGD